MASNMATWITGAGASQSTANRTTIDTVTTQFVPVTPVLVAPGQPEVIALRPEFITPQDGHTKQDCELAAAKRWLEHNATRYHSGPVTLLGDDLYAHQPSRRDVVGRGRSYVPDGSPWS
jgi:hypothetical protein